MSNVHMILTSKGGVGKSFIATVIAQYFGDGIFCADTDPANASFASYKKIGAEHFDILSEESNSNIDKSKFDRLMECILEHDGDAVIDNGSTSFFPLMAYILENNVVEFLKGIGKNIIIHSVLVGGRQLNETIDGLEGILRTNAAPVVVWENEYFGKVKQNGLSFTGTKLFADYKDRILGVINIEKRDSDTYTKDLDLMTTQRMTYEEVNESPLFLTFNRQRIIRVRRDIENQLDQIDFENV